MNHINCPICHLSLIHSKYDDNVFFCTNNNHACRVYLEDNSIIEYYLSINHIFMETYIADNKSLIVMDNQNHISTHAIPLCESLNVINKLFILNTFS